MVENNTSGVNSAQPVVKESRLDHVLSFGEGDLHHKRMEILSAIILSLATILTAWCGYQATRWSGEQALYYSEASALRIKSAQSNGQATQTSAMHVGLFVQYAAAISQDNKNLADFLYPPLSADRESGDRCVAGHSAAQKSRCARQSVPDARVRASADAAGKGARCAGGSEVCARPMKRTNAPISYVLLTVIFASVLFFGGISTQFESRAIETGMLVVAMIVLIATAAVMLTFPLK